MATGSALQGSRDHFEAEPEDWEAALKEGDAAWLQEDSLFVDDCLELTGADFRDATERLIGGDESDSPPTDSAELLAASAILLAPERVRYATLIKLSPVVHDGPAIADESGAAIDGVVINISTDGVACVTSLEVDVGAKLDIDLSVDLGKVRHDARAIPCQVMWRSQRERGERSYGLRFVDLDNRLRSRIEALVSVRAGHRGGDEVTHHGGGPSAEGRSRGGRIGQALAVIVGVVIGAAAVAAIATASSDSVPVVGDQASFDAAPIASDMAPSDSEDLAGDQASPDAVPVASAIAPLASGDLTLSESITNDAGPNDAGEVIVAASDVEIELFLRADGDGTGMRHFWMANPRRLVIDLVGRRSGLGASVVELGHPLAQRLRAGDHSDKVRYVVDLGGDVEVTASLAERPGGVLVKLFSGR